MAKAGKRARHKAEKLVRRMIREKYPAVESGVDELASSGLWGDSHTLLEAMVEIARAQVIGMVGQKSPLIAKTIERMHNGDFAPKRKK